MPSSFADMLQRSVIVFVIFFISSSCAIAFHPSSSSSRLPLQLRSHCFLGFELFGVQTSILGSFVRSLPRSFVRSPVRLVLKFVRSIFFFHFCLLSFLPSFLPSLLHSFIPSFVPWFLSSSLPWFIRPFVRLLRRSVARPLSLVLLRSCIHSFAHTLPPFFVCSCTCLRSLVRLSPCVACSIALCFVSGC